MFKRIGLTLFAALMFAGMTFAQPGMGPGMGRGPGKGMGMGRGMRMGRMGGPGPMAVWKNKELLQKAGISPEQAQKMRDMHFQSQRERIKSGSEMKLKQLEMAELMDADKPDDGKILAKAKEISALREKIFLSGVQQGLATKKLITPEQEQKLKDAMREKHSELGPPSPDMMFGMGPPGPEMMGPGPGDDFLPPPHPDAPEPPEGMD